MISDSGILPEYAVKIAVLSLSLSPMISPNSKKWVQSKNMYTVALDL